MKIVVALDSFKGGLSAGDACQAVADGLRSVAPDIEIILKPMADGGEGSAAAMLAARPGGEWIKANVTGPLLECRVAAGFAWFPALRLAVVEMAAASGLPLLADSERNPLKTSTYGTGELLRAAIDRGAAEILLAIGGSATVDGGIGAAAALGWKFLNKNGETLSPDGGHLRDIASVIPPKAKFPKVTVLCDVSNPLCGPRGAAAVFGPQKGATPSMVEALEAGLANLAAVVGDQLGFDMSSLEGGGAAGGLGAGAAAFFKAKLVPGIATIMEVSKLPEALKGADWCVTGEGSFDNQSLDGKVVSGVAAAAKTAGVPVVVFAGNVKADPERYQARGIQLALATHKPDMPMAEVMRRERELLHNTAARWLTDVGMFRETCYQVVN